jgi:hypothetical protein
MRHAGVTPDLLHRFSPPAGLPRSAPRDVRLTGGGRVLMGLAWLLAAAAIVAGGLLYREASRQYTVSAAIDQRGVTTTAVIDRVWRKTDDGKPAFASFHFDAAGTRIAGETRMHLDAWRELRAGSIVRVRYLQEDPSRLRLDGARVKRLPFAIPYVVSGVLASIALLCAFAISHQRWLLMEGRLAPAVVTAITTHKESHGHSHCRITYEFPLLGGGVGSGKAGAPKGSAVGATIAVLYDPNKPGRSHPYPFSLVTANVDEV